MRRALSLTLALGLLGAAAPGGQVAATGFGVVGDSRSDEYRADDNRGGSYAATTFNWIELLARYRGFDLGTWDVRSSPRRTGYEFDWALSGSRIEEVLSTGQVSGLASQIAAGRVGRALFMAGSNDFATWNGTYAEIYDGTLSGAALEARITALQTAIASALDTLRAAGPVQLFVATVADPGTGSNVIAMFPDATKRQRVTAALQTLNQGIVGLAAARQAYVIDLDVLTARLLPQVDANGNLSIGGQLISLVVPGDEPHHVMLSDNGHFGTVASGLLANFILETLNTAGGTVVPPFSDTEMLTNAGIVPEPPDTTPPAVTVTSPANQATVSGTVTLAATATDAKGVAGVLFKVDGVNVGTEDTSAPYSRSWSTTGVASGSHVVSAHARDAAGNLGAASVTVNIAADVTAPAVSFTAPASGATVSGSIAVSASATDAVGVAGVLFKVDGVTIGAEDATSPYSVTWNTTTVGNGSHTLSATARDAAGNSATITRAISVQQPEVRTAAAVTVTQGTLASGTVTSLNANDNNYLQVRGATSGLGSASRAELGFDGVALPVSKLVFTGVWKSNVSSETVTVSIYAPATNSWVTLNSASIGTSEVTRTITVTTNPAQYVSAAGSVRIAIQGSRLFGSHTTLIDLTTLTVTH